MHILKRIFNICFITAFVIMVVSQVLLKNTDLKSKLSWIYNIETQYVFNEQKKTTGFIVLQTTAPSKDIYVLQNGEKICNFDEGKIKIEIFDNSVIEIDGCKHNSSNIVKIIEITDNLNGYYNDEITIKSNIQILGRFFIK